MKNLYRLVIGFAALLAALPSQGAVSCSISASPELKVIYAAFWTNVNLQGTINLTCTRDPSDPPNYNIWIGMGQGANGNDATVEGGTATIAYELFHNTTAAGTWTNTGSVNPGSATDGAVDDQLRFGTGTTDTASYAFYLRVRSWQLFKPAGVYVDDLPITIRRNNSNGTIVATDTLPVYISVPRACRFSTPPSPIDVNYPAFSPGAVTGASNFALTCTQGTDYTIALDQTRSVIPTVELAYSLSLSQTDATGTAVAQPYTVNISVDPGQAGRCSGSTCTGTDTRTLTVTY